MKTVFILGAGFSIPCGAPSQGQIIDKILALKTSSNFSKTQNQFLSELLQKFKDFSTDNLFVSQKDIGKLALEDILTPLDRCILEDISFRDVDPKNLIKIREDIYTLIKVAISNNIQTPSKDYIEKFVSYLIEQTKVRSTKPEKDTVAVISTNWDIILDNCIQQGLNNIKGKGEDFAGVIDYCCYISSLVKDDKKIKPGLQALGMGKFNVKLLKLHGSMNWLMCPRCQRLYVKYYKSFQGVYIIKKHYCRHCQVNFTAKEHESIRLRTNLIMPTFLKTLDNFQIKLVWQNAAIELSEADKVVFIGYSLPQADFELRQLLSRMLRKHVKVEVVLTEYDKPVKPFTEYSASHRFKTFFSGTKVNVTYEGVEKYVNELVSKEAESYSVF